MKLMDLLFESFTGISYHFTSIDGLKGMIKDGKISARNSSAENTTSKVQADYEATKKNGKSTTGMNKDAFLEKFSNGEAESKIVGATAPAGYGSLSTTRIDYWKIHTSHQNGGRYGSVKIVIDNSALGNIRNIKGPIQADWRYQNDKSAYILIDKKTGERTNKIGQLSYTDSIRIKPIQNMNDIVEYAKKYLKSVGNDYNKLQYAAKNLVDVANNKQDYYIKQVERKSDRKTRSQGSSEFEDRYWIPLGSGVPLTTKFIKKIVVDPQKTFDTTGNDKNYKDLSKIEKGSKEYNSLEELVKLCKDFNKRNGNLIELSSELEKMFGNANASFEELSANKNIKQNERNQELYGKSVKFWNNGKGKIPKGLDTADMYNKSMFRKQRDDNNRELEKINEKTKTENRTNKALENLKKSDKAEKAKKDWYEIANSLDKKEEASKKKEKFKKTAEIINKANNNDKELRKKAKKLFSEEEINYFNY